MKLIPVLIFLIWLFFATSHAKTGDATYYDLGLTACGKVYTDNDFVAATAFSYWKNPNPNNDAMCKRRARVKDRKTGNSVEVMIKDKCSSCSPNDIDLSKAALQKLQPLSAGRIKVDWDFIN